MANVNLDALIQREDFENVGKSVSQQLTNTLTISELVKGKGFFYASLRKPDFQRETGDWDKVKVADFIKSFLDGDLIPSIILWNAGQYTFVIDGAHRLSSLIAWANDDYGDGFISQAFFNHDIDNEQKLTADQTRRYINKEIGSYSSFLEAISEPDKANPDTLAKAQKLGFLSVHLQWVQGDIKKAENSFFKINERSTPISETEKAILKSRRQPVSIASRAIMRSGSGHKYWSVFDKEVQDNIEVLATEINEGLFTPETKNPIKTLDLPLGGKNYSSKSLPLIFELVKLANSHTKDVLDDDNDGSLTVSYLKNTNKIIRRFTTTHVSSVGLHPAVYFYSEKGRYQPTAFMAWIEIFKEYEHTGKINKFIEIRENLENYLLKRKNITNQVTVKYGSGLKGYKQLADVYKHIINNANLELETIDLSIQQQFAYLKIDEMSESPHGKDFNSNTKSEIFLRDAISGVPKCMICNGLVHVKSITFDHVQRRQDGGLGIASNGQLAHPYCNSTYKN